VVVFFEICHIHVLVKIVFILYFVVKVVDIFPVWIIVVLRNSFVVEIKVALDVVVASPVVARVLVVVEFTHLVIFILFVVEAFFGVGTRTVATLAV
jgi:hypothetical protein